MSKYTLAIDKTGGRLEVILKKTGAEHSIAIGRLHNLYGNVALGTPECQIFPVFAYVHLLSTCKAYKNNRMIPIGEYIPICVGDGIEFKWNSETFCLDFNLD